MKDIFLKSFFTLVVSVAFLHCDALPLFDSIKGSITDSSKYEIRDHAGRNIGPNDNVKTSNGSIPKTDDEFVGPFDSWLNAKKEFGAKGDGVTDDTDALQNAFNAAASGKNNNTLYLPAGTYLIKSTLTMNYHINVSIVGADPTKTIIKWAGAAHGTMMQINGTAYSKFNRITFNGNKIAGVAVEQSWDGKKPHFDTSNEYADDVFIDVDFGLHGGGLGHGFAETSILRDKFIRNTSAGVSLGNFNALDIWIRNSLFQDCTVGVTNGYGAGNFRVYNCVFRNSTNSDIFNYNTGGFSIRYNTSTHSHQFFLAGGTPNPATTIIERNTIIDPVIAQAITVNNQGPTIFINNIVRSHNSTTAGPVAVFNGSPNSDTFSMGNTFTVANPVAITSKKIEYNDKVVSPTSLNNLKEQVLPDAEPNLHRKVFEVPTGADAASIQSIINEAVRMSGTRPVVHFPLGNYNISTTIFIPANADVQLVGDSYGRERPSMLTWRGTTLGPIISIAGPGKATLRDITLNGNGAAINILITNVDQEGSRIFLQEVYHSGGGIGLSVNQLDHTVVFGYDTQFSGLKKAIDVVGGPFAAAGKPAEGRTIIYSGAESGNDLSHEVSNGGNLMVQDAWYEGGNKSIYANLSGNGIFAADGNHISTPQHTDVPSVKVNNFSGKAIFAADDFTDRFAINGDGSRTKILALGIMAEDDPIVADTSSPKADMRLLLSRTRDYHSNVSGSGSYTISDIGRYDQTFVDEMLANILNIHPIILDALPKGVSDIRLYRVMLINGAKGLDIEGGANLLPLK
ncbi:MAG TPA: glycosyl hydrolase family 28-related protein [Mucilaginibacter sp.]|jgi:hypothetical protein